MWRGQRGTGLLRVYVGECAGSHSVGWSRKRWIDNVKDYLRKRDLDVRQARRMVKDKSEWGIAWEMNPRPSKDAN